MQKLILLLTLSFFSTQGLAASCPDGSEPIKTVSADGSYFIYECAINSESTPYGASLDFSKCDIDKNSDSNLPFYCSGDDGKLLTKSEIKTIIKEKKWVTNYESWAIPYKASPNDETLKFYIVKQKNNEDSHDKQGATGSENPYQFQSELREDKYITEQMQETALLSYLFFEDGKIVIDEITPDDRFGKLFNNETGWTSASVGKSIVSYITGHAICGGYIDSVDSRLDDWSLLQNTLYEGQKLIDLLNMSAGDQEYSGSDLKINGSSRGEQTSPHNDPLKHHMEGFFKNSKKGNSLYSYSNIVPDIIINYVMFKSKGDFQKILDEAFKEKARIKNTVFFLKIGQETKDEDGPGWYSFNADRYDYLRIAKAIMEDWQNDTCVGKYLKTVYERKINKHRQFFNAINSNSYSREYGGQFHFDMVGMGNRKILSMSGLGGQEIIIDVERSRIIVVNAMHDNYDWKRIVYEKIKSGSQSSISTVKVKQPDIDPQQLILDNKAKQEAERIATQYWNNYTAMIFGDSADWGASADGSTMFSEDFENTDQRDVRVEVSSGKWYIKPDNDGNSIYCNKATNGESNLTVGSKDWSDYSISYRMKFPAGKGGKLQTQIRQTDEVGRYSAIIDNLSGSTTIKYVEAGDRYSEQRISGGLASTKADEWSEIQLIASGNNIKHLIDGKVVASAKDSRIKKGSGYISVIANSEVCVDDIVVNKFSVSEALELGEVDRSIDVVTSPENYIDNKKEGKFTTWYENGQIKSEENYKDGKKEGKSTTWYQSGEILRENNYKNGKKEGKFTNWYENAQKKSEENYLDDKREGKSTWWHEDGLIKSDTNYKNNYKEGKETTWYESGQIKSEINYIKGGGKETTWYESGQIKSERNYKNNKREGKETSWYENGQIESEIHYKNNKREGKETSWYENGQIKSERNYKGDKDGVFSLFANQKEGKFTTWYENGQIKSEIHYKNNKREGKETTWHENGQIKSENNYQDGIRI